MSYSNGRLQLLRHRMRSSAQGGRRRRPGRFRVSRPPRQPGPAVRPRLAHPRASGDRGPDRRPRFVRRDGRLEAVPYDEAVALAAGAALPLLRRRDRVPGLAARVERGQFRPGQAGPGRSFASERTSAWPRTRATPPRAEVLLEGAGMPAMLGALTEIRKAELHPGRRRGHRQAQSDRRERDPYGRPGGADLVTLSSRPTQIAKLSRTHLWLKPGTKRLALAAAAKVLVDQGWQDEAFRPGPDRRVRRTSPAPRRRSTSTGARRPRPGLDPAEIEDLARRLSGAPSAMAFFSSGISGLDRGAVALLYDLFLAAGKIGREGCGVNPVTGDLQHRRELRRGRRTGSFPDTGGPRDRSAGRTPRRAPRGRPDAAQGPGRRRPRRGDRPARRQDQGARVRRLYRRLRQPVRRLRPHRPAVGDLRRGRRDLSPTPSAGSSSTAGRSSLPPASFPAWRIYADIAARRGAAWAYASAEDVMADIAASVPGLRRPSPTPSSRRASACSGRATPRHPGRHRPPRRRGRGAARLRFVDAGAGFEAPAVAGGLPLPAHGRQGQLLLAPEQHHEEDPYPQAGIQRPAPPVSRGIRRDRGRGRRRRSASATAGPSTSSRPAARCGSPSGSPGTSSPGRSTCPTSSRTMVPGFLERPGAAIDEGEDSVIPVRIEKV